MRKRNKAKYYTTYETEYQKWYYKEKRWDVFKEEGQSELVYVFVNEKGHTLHIPDERGKHISDLLTEHKTTSTNKIKKIERIGGMVYERD